MLTSVPKYKLGVIGCGFMAQAVLFGAIECGFLMPEEIIVSDPDEEKRRAFSRKGMQTADDNRTVAQNCRFLFFAVKPQSFDAVADDLKGVEVPVALSIMAGKSKRFIHNAVSCGAVARIMPNLPCAVGEGITAIDVSELDPDAKDFVFGLFGSVGKTVSADESELNAVTGISGSGPAYVYLFLKSLAQAGIAQGLSEEKAVSLALQTVKGGVAMAEQTEKSFDELIAAVSSKGGTTVAALESFARDDFAGSVNRAVNACVKRAEELSR